MMAAALPQLLVPHADPTRPTLLIIGTHRRAGRLVRCLRCGRHLWTAFGHAARHHRSCRSTTWPGGRP